MSTPIKRCALYTRKSTEEGLEQEFNTLDAQREACASYVKSQASEGWRVIETRYDDGGFSGGSMERPALQRLLADIAASRIDVVVVYKIDRLTRALADFARMIELFDTHNVSFVSVTQSFNTTSSMGRLTLNVLLSFAQFEREVTGERIRDKIAASKARGMWMGGCLPLGYDLPAPGSRALVINRAEAETVRAIFTTYLELGSVHALQRWLDARGIRSKRRVTRKGREIGGQSFSRGALFHLLRNQTYLGLIVHKGEVHPGQHAPIVDAETFEAVQTQLDGNARRHAARREDVAHAPLKSRIFDADGQPMSPTFSYGRKNKLYRYYVSAPLQQGQRRLKGDDTIRRVPAAALEAKLTDILRRLLPAESEDPLGLLTRMEIKRGSLDLLLPIRFLPVFRDRLADGETAQPDPANRAQLRLTLPVRIPLRGGGSWVIGGAGQTSVPDPVLVKALRAAHAMIGRDASGLPILDVAPSSPYDRRLLRLAFLAPSLQRAIFAGEQPPDLTLKKLLQRSFPLVWSAQQKDWGIARTIRPDCAISSAPP